MVKISDHMLEGLSSRSHSLRWYYPDQVLGTLSARKQQMPPSTPGDKYYLQNNFEFDPILNDKIISI